mmetsp:Transcript_15769/g.23211  ORF Transcript_15769/g.23211 Transcript_15769/m.23211 type:complete len:995 (-) Transcript_15769:952-3936(-)|eukprot:CAMPEP_0194217336 /NCGR_PEP_ID=MMETSP0156-20130528/21021_1 /TAXON_ID=33649 /ORGANISM="Thalassionema nitzschioides, Strain L26-B" /LENGTH=994 /DNA_ID=CAMNT_0038946357 /DNA_START=34 /DNA_END=3018 /DNA_ORIENTATION=-
MSSGMETTSSPVPTKKMLANAVTPVDETLTKRMAVESGVVDELLLVCGVIGTTTGEGSELVPVTDCLNWLQDLQRALRRDDDMFRPISLLLGKWKVAQQKLLPLVMTCRYDSSMILTIVKILVILTKPVSEATKQTGRLAINPKKYSEQVVKQKIKERENALAQSEMLMDLKRAVVHHPSHSKSAENNQGGLLSVFVSLLAEPISKTGSSRNEMDHLTIELVLHLFRNLLAAEPLMKSSTDASQASARIHQEMVCLFKSELVFDILLVVAQDMDSRENQNYNLIMMELLNLLLKNQDPTAVARSVKVKSTLSHQSQGDESGSLLRANLRKEKQKIRGMATSRHSNFGGTLMVNRGDGRRQYLSAALMESSNQRPAAKLRRNRKREAFVGSGRTMASHTRGVTSASPLVLRAQQTIHDFCEKFLSDSYGPLMKSLKNEFRRESVRLEEGDRVIFFRLVWFFCQWWRVSRKSNLEHLIFTMDVFSFRLVLGSIDSFMQHKKHQPLAQALALYSEMTHLLHFMYSSKDPTENVMALGLMDTLYYCRDPLDCLPKLLSNWAPSTMTREYLCDLVEAVHVSLKLLETHCSSCLEEYQNLSNPKKENNGDTLLQMKANAADFDFTSYLARKIISNKIVCMYTHLLSQYTVNSAHVNHRIMAFLLRLSKLNIAVSEKNEDSDTPQNLLATKTVTLEPMLYNINMLLVLERILNDKWIRREKEFSHLLSFATRLMDSFAAAAERNPLLYVESLFRHPLPHRFCDFTTNHYVNEELRMIAERELLLEEHRRMMEEEMDNEGANVLDDDVLDTTSNKAPQKSALDDEDEEIEWDELEKSTENSQIEIKKQVLDQRGLSEQPVMDDSPNKNVGISSAKNAPAAADSSDDESLLKVKPMPKTKAILSDSESDDEDDAIEFKYSTSGIKSKIAEKSRENSEVYLHSDSDDSISRTKPMDKSKDLTFSDSESEKDGSKRKRCDTSIESSKKNKVVTITSDAENQRKTI